MAEIRLKKRYKYAGDIMPKLLDIGFDLETASDFLNDIPDADVAPRAEVAEKIFWEIDKLLTIVYTDDEDGRKFIGVDMQKYYALKKKYTEGEK